MSCWTQASWAVRTTGLSSHRPGRVHLSGVAASADPGPADPAGSSRPRPESQLRPDRGCESPDPKDSVPETDPLRAGRSEWGCSPRRPPELPGPARPTDPWDRSDPPRSVEWSPPDPAAAADRLLQEGSGCSCPACRTGPSGTPPGSTCTLHPAYRAERTRGSRGGSTCRHPDPTSSLLQGWPVEHTHPTAGLSAAWCARAGWGCRAA